MILADKKIENSYIERKNTKSTYEDRNAMSNQDTTVLINQAEDGHTKGEGKCVQKDDMEKVIPAYLDADMVVFATPIYYFDMTAQLAAAIQRVYCIGKPAKATKAAMLISSGTPGAGEGAIVSYKNMLAFMGIEDAGVCALAGEENQSEEKLAEIRAWAKSL